MHKEVKELLREVEAAGCTWEQGKSGHIKVKSSDGRQVAVLPLTPGRGRALNNLRAALRRQGILVSNH